MTFRLEKFVKSWFLKTRYILYVYFSVETKSKKVIFKINRWTRKAKIYGLLFQQKKNTRMPKVLCLFQRLVVVFVGTSLPTFSQNSTQPQMKSICFFELLVYINVFVVLVSVEIYGYFKTTQNMIYAILLENRSKKCENWLVFRLGKWKVAQSMWNQ